MEKNTVVCMKWGTKYGPDYVNKLYNMTRRNLTLPFKFICFTDNASGLLPEIEVRPLPKMALPDPQERGWRKLALFGRDAGLEGRVLFLDLDTVIVSNIDEYFKIDGDIILIKHWKPSVKHGIGETGVYRFDAGSHPELLEYFLEHMDEVKASYRHEQAYVCAMTDKAGILSFWPEEWMPSFKYVCMRPFPLCFFLEPRLPAAAKMVVFHGTPTPDEALHGKMRGFKKFFRHAICPQWLRDNWR